MLVTPDPKTESPQKLKGSPLKTPAMKDTKDEDDELCIICLELKVSHACIPCGHLKYCEKCVKIIVDRNECAVCRSKVQSVYKIFT